MVGSTGSGSGSGSDRSPQDSGEVMYSRGVSEETEDTPIATGDNLKDGMLVALISIIRLILY